VLSSIIATFTPWYVRWPGQVGGKCVAHEVRIPHLIVYYSVSCILHDVFI